MSDRTEYRIVDKDGLLYWQATSDGDRFKLDYARKWLVVADAAPSRKSPHRVECRSVGEWREVEKEQT